MAEMEKKLLSYAATSAVESNAEADHLRRLVAELVVQKQLLVEHIALEVRRNTALVIKDHSKVPRPRSVSTMSL